MVVPCLGLEALILVKLRWKLTWIMDSELNLMSVMSFTDREPFTIPQTMPCPTKPVHFQRHSNIPRSFPESLHLRETSVCYMIGSTLWTLPVKPPCTRNPHVGKEWQLTIFPSLCNTWLTWEDLQAWASKYDARNLPLSHQHQDHYHSHSHAMLPTTIQ